MLASNIFILCEINTNLNGPFVKYVNLTQIFQRYVQQLIIAIFLEKLVMYVVFKIVLYFIEIVGVPSNNALRSS